MSEQGELELTNEQLVQICKFAERVEKGEEQASPAKLAFCLKAVALCLHSLQAGDQPVIGPEVDKYYDETIGHDVRMMWMRVKPVAEKLKEKGVIG